MPTDYMKGAGMPILEIHLTLRDYEEWKRRFDEDPADRAAVGVRRYQILRAADDPNSVTALLEFDSVEEAEAFRTAITGVWDRDRGRVGLEEATARVMEIAEAKELTQPSAR